MSRIAAVVLVVALLLAACSDDKKPATAASFDRLGAASSAGDTNTFAVTASPQRSDGKSVVLDSVTIEQGKKGYAAVYADGNGAPGKLLGASALLNSGENRLVRVTLNEPLAAGKSVLHVVVHVESNNNSSFEFPGADAPAMVGPGVVTARFEADVSR